jgi:hypothetical protein
MSDRTYVKKAKRNRTTAGSLTAPPNAIPYMDSAAEQKLRMRRARRRVGKQIVKEQIEENISPLHNE